VNADKEEKLGLVRGNHGDNETVAGSRVRMGARSGAGLYQGVCMFHRLAHSFPGAVASRPLHSSKYIPNDGLIAAPIKLEISASHFDRSDGPAITKTHKGWAGQRGIGWVKPKTICNRDQPFARQILGQRTEIGIARDRDSRNEV
jgi:hypothetical protein